MDYCFVYFYFIYHSDIDVCDYRQQGGMIWLLLQKSKNIVSGQDINKAN